MNKRKNNVMYILIPLLLAGAGLLLITDSEGVFNAASSAISTCLNVVIPSLFSFMVFSVFLVKSGFGERLFRPLYVINKFWFKGDEKLFAVFMLSLFGGYPVGVKLLSEITAQNKNYSAISSIMLSYCYCGSPSFVIAVVGLQLFGSSRIGLLVYLSNLLASLTAAVAVNLFIKPTEVTAAKENAKAQNVSVGNCLIESVSSAVSSLSLICGTIMLFYIFAELLKACSFLGIFPENVRSVILSTLEITNISSLGEKPFGLIPVISAVCSTGGCCILMQAAAIAKGRLNLKPFLLARIPVAALSGLYCFLLINTFKLDIFAMANTEVIHFSYSEYNPICSICLIFMCYILLKSTRKNSRFL